MARDRLDGLAMGLMVALCAIWGLQQISVKVANAGIAPIVQAGLRSFGAALLLWAWCAIRRVPLFDRDGSLPAGLLAGLLFAGEFLLLFVALDHTTAGRGVLFLYTAPFVVAIGAHLLVPGERLNIGQVAGLVCAFAGVALAFAEGLGAAGGSVFGDVLAIGAAILWGATTVLIKATRLARVRASKTLFYQLVVSAVVLLPMSLVLDRSPSGPLTPLVLGALGFQIVIVAFISYLAWFWLIAHYPASRLSAFGFLTPLFGMALGALLLDERVTPLLALALTLVAIGIWLVNRRPALAAVQPLRNPAAP